jgi:phage portal protein BeeE
VAFWDRFRRRDEVTEATKALTPSQLPERAGYAYGIPRGGLNEYNSGVGEATQTDRRSQLAQLYESYLACPWSWASVQAIARTITAGGLVMDWDTDTGEGDQDAPEKPASVLACERLFAYCNARQNIRQLLRNVVVDLEVFGDAFIEITWWDDTPVAIYNLDNPTTSPQADEHGNVTGYVQIMETGARADFEPRDVIHISLDAPRSGVFGVSPTQAALLPITAWLFAAATGKEMARKGLPTNIHVDFPQGTQLAEQNRWLAQYSARNIGPRNIGTPIATKGGAHVAELAAGKITDVITFLNQKRDEIVASYGVPPAKAGIIESGNLGGGTGEEQDITYKVDTCGPIAELVLEAINYAIVGNGFGADGWRAKFREVDYRSSQAIEAIRDMRLRNGSWVLNKYRTEVGEPPVDGGDDAVLVDRQMLVLWRDIARMSEAGIAAKGAPAVAAGEVTPGGEPMQPDGDGQEPGVPAEAYRRYRARLKEAMRVMPGGITEASGGKGGQVYAQLAGSFAPSAIEWVKDAKWTGPAEVPLGDIEASDRGDWRASADTAAVKAKRRKLRKALAKGEKPKPLILVRRPSGKLLIADGHHRFLAAEAEGLKSVWAYTGTVDEQAGPWNQLGARQDRGERAA